MPIDAIAIGSRATNPAPEKPFVPGTRPCGPIDIRDVCKSCFGTDRGHSNQTKDHNMSIQLNHTIVSAKDRDHSARFLSEMLGLPDPKIVEPFAVVQIGETSLDFVQTSGEIQTQHYAFLVTEVDFDAIFQRVTEHGLHYWADPSHRKKDKINTWDGGRGLYWDDPSGHLLEIITRPYGTGGSTTDNPHPLATNSVKNE